MCSPGISFISIQFYHEIALCCNEHFCFRVTVSSKHLQYLLFSVQREIRLFHKSTDAMMIQSNIQDLIKKGKKIRIPKRWHFLVEPKQFCPIWYSICVAAPLSIDSIFNRFSSSSGNDCCMPTKVFFTCTLKIDFLSRRKFESLKTVRNVSSLHILFEVKIVNVQRTFLREQHKWLKSESSETFVWFSYTVRKDKSRNNGNF